MSGRPDQYLFLEKPLPSNTDAENTLLGAILIDNDSISDALEITKPDDCYKPQNRMIFEAMTRLFGRGEVIDPILISEEIKRFLGVTLTSSEISCLLVGIPSQLNIRQYAEVIRDKAIARKLIKISNETLSLALSEDETISETLDKAEQAIYELRNSEKSQGASELGSLIETSFADALERAKNGISILGLASGFTDLDAITAGLQKTDLIIIAGRPSMGKSAVAADIARQATAINNANVVAVFSLEMSKEQFANRMLCAEAEVNSNSYRTGHLAKSEWERVRESALKLHERKIFIDDAANLTALEIKARARKTAIKHKRLDLIIVDYLQIMGGNQSESRQQEVSQIARDLKAMAKDLQVPVIALSQLSRACESRNPPRPKMSDLRESGSIEQEADIVSLMYRPEYYEATEENKGYAEMIIAKNRNGATGTIKLAFLKEFAKFGNFYQIEK